MIRHVEETDYHEIITLVDEWWGGRHVVDSLPKLFFTHFRNTSFVMEDDHRIVGFLIGFISQTYPNLAYVHFLGIHPKYRNLGNGKRLYQCFFDAVMLQGCDTVRLLTSPVNTKSIAFHTRIGFQIEEGDRLEDGISIHSNYDGPGKDRVLFVKRLLNAPV